MEKKKIHIVVGGRYHADYMAHSLIRQGHDVKVLTTFPRGRFPQPIRSALSNLCWPEAVYRFAREVKLGERGDKLKVTQFGKWAASQLDPCDLLIAWSSFGLESLKKNRAIKSILVRDSTHIEHQFRLLNRQKKSLSSSRQFITERELEEYELCDYILVPSQYVKDTFTLHGVAEQKVKILRLGVNTNIFYPANHWIPKLPLRIVFFGTVGFRKGVDDLIAACRYFSKGHIQLSLVGPIEKALKPLLEEAGVTHHPPMPHSQLSHWLREHDVYGFPTLEDGFGMTLLEAMASGLIPISTDQCGAAECLKHKENGFIIPTKSPEAMASIFEWMIQNLRLLPGIRNGAIETAKSHSWLKYGHQLSQILTEVYPTTANC